MMTEYIVIALWVFFTYCVVASLILMTWMRDDNSNDAHKINRLNAIAFAILALVTVDVIERFSQ